MLESNIQNGGSKSVNLADSSKTSCGRYFEVAGNVLYVGIAGFKCFILYIFQEKSW